MVIEFLEALNKKKGRRVMSDVKIAFFTLFMACACVLLGAFSHHQYLVKCNYILNKSEYNELRQDGKVWAYVRKDGKL